MTRYEILKELSKKTTKEQLDQYMKFNWDNELLIKLIERYDR